MTGAMCPLPTVVLLAAFALSTALAAQQVTMTWSLPSPLLVTTVVAGSTNVRTAATMPGSVVSTQTTGGDAASAQVTTVLTQSAVACSLLVEHRLDAVTGGGAGAAAGATSDVVLQLTAMAFESVAIQIDTSLLATAGVPAPAFYIDMDDDGTADFQGGPPAPQITFARVLSPTPTLVRVHVDSTLAIAGSLQAGLSVTVLPTHATQVDVVLFGCSVPYHLYAFRTFGGGIEFGTFGLPPTAPVLLVFGLSVFPFVLPSAAPSPCIVLPTIDIVTLIPSPNGYSLPLPPSVRPVTFWAQAVPLTPAGFEATGAYRVQAN